MTTENDSEITAYIIGGTTLTAIVRCEQLGIVLDDKEVKGANGIRRLGVLNGVPVWLDEGLSPDKVLITRKQKDPDTP